jgi:hypothetical protein
LFEKIDCAYYKLMSAQVLVSAYEVIVSCLDNCLDSKMSRTNIKFLHFPIQIKNRVYCNKKIIQFRFAVQEIYIYLFCCCGAASR